MCSLSVIIPTTTKYFKNYRGLQQNYRSDPDEKVQGWQPNSRGISFVFGVDVLTDVCEKLNIDLIARAHQVHLIRG